MLAQQIADLVNENNNLTREVTARDVKNANYTFLCDETERVVACVKITRVSWYQVELSHLVVASRLRGRGIAGMLISSACAAAAEAGAHVVQCTIVVDNEASERVFARCGFVPTVTFLNPASNNLVTTWQKVLTSSRDTA